MPNDALLSGASSLPSSIVAEMAHIPDVRTLAKMHLVAAGNYITGPILGLRIVHVTQATGNIYCAIPNVCLSIISTTLTILTVTTKLSKMLKKTSPYTVNCLATGPAGSGCFTHPGR